MTPYLLYIGGRGGIKMASVSTRSANEQANDLILVQIVQLNSTNLRMYSVRFSILLRQSPRKRAQFCLENTFYFPSDKLQLVLLHYLQHPRTTIPFLPIELFYYQSQCKLKPCALSDQIAFVSQQRYIWVLKTVQGGVQDRIR